MLEIEVKAQLQNPEMIFQKFKHLGIEFSEPKRQRDRVYLPKGMNLGNVQIGTPTLRIREQADKSFLTLKQNKNLHNNLDKVEHETSIEDPKEMWKHLEEFGVKKEDQAFFGYDILQYKKKNS